MRVPPALEEFHHAVQVEMRRLLEGRELPLYTMLRYHLGWVDVEGRAGEGGGGKGLRSTLCLLANQAVGGEFRQALPAAAALELVHNFSLIHDDIQDGSPERRHRPTVWRVWGAAQAINAGDSLFSLGRLALYRLAEMGVPAPEVLHLERVLDETCLRLCEGQYMDLEFQSRLDISVKSYLQMIERKTAALMEAACYLGAFLGAGEHEATGHLRRAGKHLGYAFQVRDDVLGIWGEAASLGKPVAEDVRTRKKSLPVIIAFHRAETTQRELLEEIYARRRMTDRDVQRVLQIFEQMDARAEAQRTAEDHAAAALRELASVGPSSPALDQLRELTQFAVEREF